MFDTDDECERWSVTVSSGAGPGPPPGPALPSALKLNKAPPASSLVQPISQAAQAQKAFWNKNGSITVMEVCKPPATKIRNTKKISWPDPQPEKQNRIRSEAFVQNKIKPKMFFPPTAQLAERKRKKAKAEEEKPPLITRNFSWRGKKVVNLGDTETPPLQTDTDQSDLLAPDIEW